MSKQLEGILGRATRATPTEVTKSYVASSKAPAERQELIQARVPESIKQQVLKQALEDGVTVRTFLLKALKGAGIEVDERELHDRRGKGQQAG